VIDGLEPTETRLNLSGGRQFVADLGRQLRDLVADVVKEKSPFCHLCSPVFEHGVDLGDEFVICVECLKRAGGRVRLEGPDRRTPRQRRRSCRADVTGVA
jgi:hypothetical protein